MFASMAYGRRARQIAYLRGLIGRSRRELFIVERNGNAVHFFIVRFQGE